MCSTFERNLLLLTSSSSCAHAFRHAFLSSLQDKTAFLITARFETALKEAHASMFPLSHNELPNLVQYSDPPSIPGYLFDSQPTPSPPRPPPNPTSPLHPLAPRDPSSLSSTLLPYAPADSRRRSQRLLPPAAPTNVEILRKPPTYSLPPPPVHASVPSATPSARARSTSAYRAPVIAPPPSHAPTVSLPTTSSFRARSTPAGAHQSHSGLYPPALSGVGALFRAHSPSVGRKGSGRQ